MILTQAKVIQSVFNSFTKQGPSEELISLGNFTSSCQNDFICQVKTEKVLSSKHPFMLKIKKIIDFKRLSSDC